MVVNQASGIFAGLAGLRHEVRQSKRAAFAEGTRLNMRTQLRAYLLFCLHFKLRPFPASLDTICCFAQFLARSFISVSSITNYIQLVKSLHELMEYNFPHFNQPHLKLVLKGLTKKKAYKPRQALPVTPSILRDLFQVMDLSRPLDAVLWCAFLLGFFLFARKSNLVPPSCGKYSARKHLSRGDIKLAQEGLMVQINWSKTIQAGERVLLIPLVAIPGSRLCPQAAFINMCRVSPADSSAPAFLVRSGTGVRTLTHASFTKHFRRLLKLAGHKPGGFSGHSFRRGGASFALKAGVSGELLRVHGDWKSLAYLKYLEVPLQERFRVSRCMAEVISLGTY